jgi:hypothetical protein
MSANFAFFSLLLYCYTTRIAIVARNPNWTVYVPTPTSI